jgi:hypothetical protein
VGCPVSKWDDTVYALLAMRGLDECRLRREGASSAFGFSLIAVRALSGIEEGYGTWIPGCWERRGRAIQSWGPSLSLLRVRFWGFGLD